MTLSVNFAKIKMEILNGHKNSINIFIKGGVKMNKKILALCLSICMVMTLIPSNIVLAFDKSWETPYKYDGDELVTYQITNSYTPVRDEPSKEGNIVQHFSDEEYINACVVTNAKLNKWLMFETENGEYRFVYTGNAEKHIEHCWGAAIETNAGTVSICDCGFVKAHFYKNESADYEFNGIEWLKQLLLGNYTDITYATVSIINIILGFTPVGTVQDIRDITADIINADSVSLAIDMVALIPLMDGLKVADDTNAVHYLAAFDVEGRLIADNYDFLKSCFKGVNSGIEIHHGIEKRMAECFDVHPDDFLAIPLEVAEHRIITKRFKEAIPYGIDYAYDLSYEDVINAVNYVYHDNTEIRDTMVKWVSKHWIGDD